MIEETKVENSELPVVLGDAFVEYILI